jgi:hypothetical protein
MNAVEEVVFKDLSGTTGSVIIAVDFSVSGHATNG